jgi:hypothetical protein
MELQPNQNPGALGAGVPPKPRLISFDINEIRRGPMTPRRWSCLAVSNSAGCRYPAAAGRGRGPAISYSSGSPFHWALKDQIGALTSSGTSVLGEEGGIVLINATFVNGGGSEPEQNALPMGGTSAWLIRPIFNSSPSVQSFQDALDDGVQSLPLASVCFVHAPIIGRDGGNDEQTGSQ